ncbi:MAG: Fe-S cluster assembly transcriptional regulator IscR [Pseudomonadales bacterium]|jgi:Rrf2 family iron-sulfur cluster assembly transcriptional regulator|nr:Fe-S cluster assembly transcriptional regulator IscR [Pseudomonadales bacterium]MDP7359948.1 Fe-S cluster assembly transcriptional regulator IscR [Pseudomonadales bacterium]MDP7594572.1 Fe-S cluster assembly transcriptional regulator IscR [Pseudomonadales bacterium]HJN52292.1 Fe-S cluster assembly transcriptional regulator IscR [Pseudomonadales bacterium]|tara:strand:- start:11993 stop:12469 length:477 start_codon:yes stop_codon:yes gene_type:complete
MRLTAKGRYAVTAMLDIAVHQEKGPISLADISERQGISLSYLEQLFSKLRRNELVSSVRGPGGGYKLSRDAGDIFVAQIVDSVDETVDATKCAGRANCQHGETCLTHELWADLSEQIHQFLSSIDLATIIANRTVREVADRQDAHQEENIERALAQEA